MDTIAILGLLFGGAGIGGFVNGRFERRHASDEAERERTHGDSRARAQRLFQLRAETYAEVGRMLERERMWLERIEPVIVIGDPLPVPENFEDGEWQVLIGRVAVGSSAEVLALIENTHHKFRDFQGCASRIGSFGTKTRLFRAQDKRWRQRVGLRKRRLTTPRP